MIPLSVDPNIDMPYYGDERVLDIDMDEMPIYPAVRQDEPKKSKRKKKK